MYGVYIRTVYVHNPSQFQHEKTNQNEGEISRPTLPMASCVRVIFSWFYLGYSIPLHPPPTHLSGTQKKTGVSFFFEHPLGTAQPMAFICGFVVLLWRTQVLTTSAPCCRDPHFTILGRKAYKRCYLISYGRGTFVLNAGSTT